MYEHCHPGDPGAEVMPFGKYRGKTLGEIAEIDVLYLDWVVDKIKNRELLATVGAVCRIYAHEIDSALAGHYD